MVDLFLVYFPFWKVSKAAGVTQYIERPRARAISSIRRHKNAISSWSVTAVIFKYLESWKLETLVLLHITWLFPRIVALCSTIDASADNCAQNIWNSSKCSWQWGWNEDFTVDQRMLNWININLLDTISIRYHTNAALCSSLMYQMNMMDFIEVRDLLQTQCSNILAFGYDLLPKGLFWKFKRSNGYLRYDQFVLQCA